MAASTIQILVKSDKTSVFDVPKASNVLSLKELIKIHHGIDVDDQVLVHSGKQLDNSFELSQYGIINQSVISVFNKLLGGKVHGSLSRAGKVKGQTKKVAKKEKKRPKFGRCKQRLKYNRRVLGAAKVGPGMRKRGPNSNAK